MHRTPKLLAAIVACGTALALTMPTVASANTRPSMPSAGIVAGSIMNGHRHVFKIRPGKIFEITDGVRGVRRGDRMALEDRFRRHRHHPRSPKRWHVVGSWKMHAGQGFFRGSAYASYPGLFTLRLQVLRHGHKLAGSQSNRFYVRVRRFHIHKLRKPKHHKPHRNTNLHGLAIPKHTVITDWNTVTCGDPAAAVGGDAVDVIPPFRPLGNDQPVNVWQVSFANDYVNGAWQGWYEANALPQTVDTAGSDSGGNYVTINPGTGQSNTPDELGTIAPLGYYDHPGYHAIGWDLEIQKPSTGQWYWAFNEIQTPGSYVQFDQTGMSSQQSNNCYTYPGVGLSPVK
jgi:hypothetical protein